MSRVRDGCMMPMLRPRPSRKAGRGEHPMVTDGVFAPAHVLAEAIQRRDVSSVEVMEAYLAQISRHNPNLNAVVTLEEEGPVARSRTARGARPSPRVVHRLPREHHAGGNSNRDRKRGRGTRGSRCHGRG